jgi:hypothetical protein
VAQCASAAIAHDSARRVRAGKSSPTEKPKQTYEQLIISVLPAGRGARPQRVSPAMAVLTCSMPTPQVLEGGQSLTLQDIILRIQEKYPYYAEEAQADSQTWKGSLRTTLNTKSKTFEKTNKVDSAAGKKVMYWSMRKGDAMDDGGASQGEGGMDVSASMPPDGVNPEASRRPAPPGRASLHSTIMRSSASLPRRVPGSCLRSEPRGEGVCVICKVQALAFHVL